MPKYPPLIPPFTALAVPEDPTSRREIVYGEGWQFDFNTGEFILTPTGQVARTTGVDTLIQWIRKTLITNRYTYPIYPRWYGSDLETMIGSAVATHAVAAEVLHMIKDSLLVDNRIKDISNMSATVDGDRLFASFTVISFNADIFTLQQAVNI
jgi:hypothetical protein